EDARRRVQRGRQADLGLLRLRIRPMIATATLLILTAAFLAMTAGLVSLVARRGGPPAARVLIIGSSPLAHQLVREIATHRHGRHRVAGVVDDSSEADPSFGPTVVAPLARLGSVIEELHPDRIVVALADRRGRLPMRELLHA